MCGETRLRVGVLFMFKKLDTVFLSYFFVRCAGSFFKYNGVMLRDLRILVMAVSLGLVALLGLLMPMQATFVDVQPCHVDAQALQQDAEVLTQTLADGGCVFCTMGACCGVIVGDATSVVLLFEPKKAIVSLQERREGVVPDPLWEPPRQVL